MNRMFDYGTKERNIEEADRCRAEGRAAKLNGESRFGSGSYMPADAMRAAYWRQGWDSAFMEGESINVCYKTDDGKIVRNPGTITKMRKGIDPYFCTGQGFGYWLNPDPRSAIWIEPLRGSDAAS